MAEKKGPRINRATFEIIIPVLIVAVFGVLLATEALKDFEYKVKDAFTWLTPEVPTDKHVVLIDVDDQAIQMVGMWPWSRDVHARLLLSLKELGASHLTFDIEFVDRSPVGVTSRERDRTLASKGAELGEVFGALAEGQIRPAEAADYASTILSEGIMLTARDNDAQLGRVLKVFGKAFTTLNYDLDNGSDDAAKAFDFLIEKSYLPEVSGDLNSPAIRVVPSLRGAIVPIAGEAAMAGVTNVIKDSDGTLRRIKLLYRIDDANEPRAKGKVFGQLAFVPVWDWYGRPPIEVRSDSVILKTSQLKENARPDIVIPVDPQGYMLINWPHREYKDSLTHVYVSRMLELDAAGQALYDYVYGSLRSAGYLGDNDFTALCQEAQAALDATLASGDTAEFETYKQKNAAWLAELEAFAKGPAEKDILASLDQVLGDPALSAAQRTEVEAIKATVAPNFTKLREALERYLTLRKELAATLDGAICYMGWSSTATTDIGVNPFDPVYKNVGTHAAITNTIFTGKFQNELPPWFSFAIGALLTLSMTLISRRLKTFMSAVVGFGMFIAELITVGVVYWASGTYIGALVPGLTLFVTVLAMTLIRFFSSEKDKAFYRQAFGSYLSPDVINEIIADPGKLKLGGEKKFITAMFTDVKGFSTFSEKLDPNDLVALLNRYLTAMSDIILEARGTIDKYEGDAIIAFWGAPIDLEDHAARTVRSAVLMKRAEKSLNEVLLAEGVVNTPLLTRIGINTGDMTVGNMGTAKRMDYTMMGNAVNLAARLEGVNKQYGTWILISQATREQIGDLFLVRRLDRVRVVGISTPVRLFEVVDIAAEAPDAIRNAIARFEEGLDLFEKRDWKGAAAVFEDVLKLRPDDGPASKYLERCRKFQKEAPADNWDGVFSLTEK